MKSPHIGDKQCSAEGCEESYRDHGWRATKAHKDGWFLAKDGSSFCPAHVPEWVAAWRRRKKLTGK